jgi:hypothetical protein
VGVCGCVWVCVGKCVCVGVLVRVWVCVCVCECVCVCGFCNDWGFFNLTEVFFTPWQVFPCFFLSFKANARVKLAFLDEARPALFHVLFFSNVLFFVFLFVLCYVLLCVIVYCHRVTTQLQVIRYNNNNNNNKNNNWKITVQCGFTSKLS